jgi:hypothetical protein
VRKDAGNVKDIGTANTLRLIEQSNDGYKRVRAFCWSEHTMCSGQNIVWRDEGASAKE